MIKTEHLTKRYDSLTAVDDVSFRGGPGRGARVSSDRTAPARPRPCACWPASSRPTSGTASICGHDVETDPLAAKAALGYLPEGAPSYGEMTVRRFLDFIADLRALEGARRSARLEHVIEHLQLGARARADHRHPVQGLPAPRRAWRRRSCTTRRC